MGYYTVSSCNSSPTFLLDKSYKMEDIMRDFGLTQRVVVIPHRLFGTTYLEP